MQVSVIIVNYNTYATTCNCIESIIKHTKGIGYEIILVDNSSTEPETELFPERFPQIAFIKNPENNGFAKGNNLGIQHAKGDIILLLNSDTVLTEDSISFAANFLQNQAQHTVLTVHLTYADGKYQHNARKFRSIRNELLDLARPFLYLLPYRRRAALMLNQYFYGDFDIRCDWVSGAFLMFPRISLEKLPEQKLDERYFMYGEDQLWGYQFLEKGYTSYFLSGTKLIHIANASTEPAKQLKLLKTMLAHELDIMRYRKGRGLYYYTFRLIFTFKEMIRYYIKAIALKLFNSRIR